MLSKCILLTLFILIPLTIFGNSGANRLALLMQYTTVFLGLIIALLAGVASVSNRMELKKYKFRVQLSLLSFLLSGLAAGTIASNISDHETFGNFEITSLKIFSVSTIIFKIWSYIQHASFWIGIIVALSVVVSKIYEKE